MHSIISQVQYYNAVKGKPQDPDERTFTGEDFWLWTETNKIRQNFSLFFL